MKNISILGSTGTIGRLTLDVIQKLTGKFKISGLAANRNVQILSEQIEMCSPAEAVVFDEEQCSSLKASKSTRLGCGAEELVSLATRPDLDILVVAMTGTAAVDAVLEALRLGKRVALASKEILVSYGEHVKKALLEGKGELLPIDSEHSALHQCLDGQDSRAIKRIILTASGGPFRDKDYKRATPEDVLNHPTWNMGKRITVDSATLMNKGFEVIEASWLFDLLPEKIEVVIHPQSIVHSMVEFIDGSLLAQLSMPDMRLPIEYALLYPERGPRLIEGLDLASIGVLEFSKPDFERFPALSIAYEALIKGGTSPCVLEAADHEAVEQFLSRKLDFEQIPRIINDALKNHNHVQDPSLEQIRDAQRFAREFVIKGV
ncbi:1-deoxy-D-xylulose-5-phosphate reductoisomerase [bacterium]|nr:1-deoxy-D-xylulose-5-phosphate reductoisomerase [bacterium]